MINTGDHFMPERSELLLGYRLYQGVGYYLKEVEGVIRGKFVGQGSWN